MCKAYLNFDEAAAEASACVARSAPNAVTLRQGDVAPREFAFDHVFALGSGSRFEISLCAAVEGLYERLQSAFLVLYGEKQSGKSVAAGTLYNCSRKSLVQQTLRHLFSTQRRFEVHVSCFEIFLEEMTDLLSRTDSSSCTSLSEPREHDESQMTYVKAESFEQALSLLKDCFAVRKVHQAH